MQDARERQAYDFSHWILQLEIWKDMLSLSIDFLIPQTDSSIELHIHLRNRHQPNQTSHVSFASECMASQFAILNSVKRTPSMSRVLPMHLVESRKIGYKLANITTNHLTMPYNMSVKRQRIEFLASVPTSETSKSE